MSDSKLDLAHDFAPVDERSWRALVEQELGPGGYDKLRSTLGGALEVEPIYTAASGAFRTGVPGHAPFIRGRRAALEQGTAIWAQPAGLDLDALRTAVHEDLMSGATGVVLELDGPLAAPTALAHVLQGVELPAIELAMSGAEDLRATATTLTEIAQARSFDRNQLRLFFGADPIRPVVAGTPAKTARQALAEIVSGTPALVRALPASRSFTVSSEPYHSRGANVVQELAYAIATGVEYLRAQVEVGMPASEAAAQISFRLPLGTDFFVSIALLRAARAAWTKVTRAFAVEGPHGGMHIHAVGSRRVLTQRDPWVNLLRGTASAFAALVGGADALSVQPFDAAVGVPDKQARRLARNTALIAVEESKLSLVVDPAGGAWFLEALTDQLAKAAWSAFVDIEKQGGMIAAIESGAITAALDASRERELREVATRRRAITGVSEYAALEEAKLDRPKTARADPDSRLAAPFERLRDRSDHHLAAHGMRPRVFVASIGKLPEHNARTSWVNNLLAAGGIEAVLGEGFDGVEAAVEAFSNWVGRTADHSGAKVAVICSSDARYGELGPTLAKRLVEAGANEVIVAGRPGALEQKLAAAGVTGFVYAGADVLAFLEALAAQLEVSP